MKSSAFGLMILVIAVLISNGCQKQPEKYTGPVEKITVSNIEEYSTLVWIAEHQGYFTANGLNVTNKEYPSGKLAADAMLKGEADISISAGFVFVSNAFDNPDLRILGSVAVVENVAVVARKDRGILSPADLKGKKIGVTRKSVSEFFLSLFLTYNQITLKDVELVNLDPKDMADSLLSGKVDAVSTWEPNVFAIRSRLGDNGISWSTQRGQKYYMLMLAREKFIQEKPEAVKRFVKSIVKAEAFVKANNEIAKGILAKKYGYEPAYMDAAWPQYEFKVQLSQDSLLLFEDQAQWRIKNNFTNASKIPNYLNYIYFDALEEIKPEAITIIR